MKVMTVRVPDELRLKLDSCARILGYTRNSLITQILWNYVKKLTQTNEMEQQKERVNDMPVQIMAKVNGTYVDVDTLPKEQKQAIFDDVAARYKAAIERELSHKYSSAYAPRTR